MIWLILFAVGAGWLFATWWFSPDSVTFKAVVQNVFRDLLDITAPARCLAKRLWHFWGPRLTNRAMIATVFADFAIAASGQDVWAFIGERPMLAAGIVIMNLLTPLTPASAPARLPPIPSPTGGLVNNEAIR